MAKERSSRQTVSEEPNSSSAPAPEELHPQSDSSTEPAEGQQAEKPLVVTEAAKRRRAAYKPSHKGTFIGLAVMAVILILNAAGLAFILKGQAQTGQQNKESVTLSGAALNSLGVNRSSAGTDGVQLTVNPDTSFGGKVTIAGDTTVGGQLKLNGTFSAPSGAFAKLQGGDTALQQLNVNGDTTTSNLNLRKDLTVVGASHLQGQVTVSQLMTINNNLNVAGSLSVGGTLSVKSLQVGNLSFTGHLLTTGATPGASAGGGVGSNGTASISGNDTAGTVAVNVGVNAGAGTLANVTFGTAFGSSPHVVVTPVGRSVAGMYINRTASGFSIVTPAGLAPGGYAFDYMVMQ